MRLFDGYIDWRPLATQLPTALGVETAASPEAIVNFLEVTYRYLSRMDGLVLYRQYALI
jgi:hypothetical protein